MAYSGSNAAYDLSAYEAPKQQKKLQLKVVKSPRSGMLLFNTRMISGFAVVITLLCMMVYNQVQLTEVTKDVNDLTRQLDMLESENVKMMSVLESTMSLRGIGEQAKNELGMNRRDNYQTIYIYLEQEDKIQLTEHSPNPTVGQWVQARVTAAISRIQEYIGHE